MKENNKFYAHEKVLQSMADRFVALIELPNINEWSMSKDKLISEKFNSEIWQYSAIYDCFFVVSTEGISFCDEDDPYSPAEMKMLVTFHDYRMENLSGFDIKDFTDAISTYILQQLQVRFLETEMNIDKIEAECIEQIFCTGFYHDVPRDEPWNDDYIPTHRNYYCCKVTFHALIIKEETVSEFRKW